MPPRARASRGFTLVELLIAVAIFTILALLAVPMYGEMIANSEVRNAAENILMGLRDAQARAVKNNAPAKFVLDSTGWSVSVMDPESNAYYTGACGTTQTATSAPLCVKSYKFAQGASRATLSATGEVTFNGLGQILPNIDGSDTLKQVDVSTGAIASPHNLTILIGTKDNATAMKMCDPGFSSSDPLGCPSL